MDGPDGAGEPGPLDVLVLAGGTGQRLGGASKPDVVVRGARLLDHVLNGVAAVRGEAGEGRTVVVAPAGVEVPDGVLRALEDPPLGGPVAGIAAGLARLAAEPGGPAPRTAVLTCDAPESWRALPVLVRALGAAPDRCAGVCALDGDYAQYLLGVYRTAPLRGAVAPGGAPLRDVSVRWALGRLGVRAVGLGGLAAAARDLDTWDEVRAWERSGWRRWERESAR
ncbi:molybdopterin-guanine dinucleotide biosynthesis protein MobA [Actinomyces sp. oral taxon 414]|uniref:molybdenum cofactor guanylyltransferase n=1 Tax=Actinomyces sp. oral taxon 414 TaxID=712122 RepID=UPI0006AE6B69|nr:NTP transferase domain-containing protein [Actinomyces sp. oral taxon 414]ALC99682.1 molybdopterin-guanine dinucleotide biosynthesis protein MobA [Actinomyces sp. oral taxon 414]